MAEQGRPELHSAILAIRRGAPPVHLSRRGDRDKALAAAHEGIDGAAVAQHRLDILASSTSSSHESHLNLWQDLHRAWLKTNALQSPMPVDAIHNITSSIKAGDIDLIRITAQPFVDSTKNNAST